MSSSLIGLTGGIGCGKTEVAAILSRNGFYIIDADRIGKKIVDNNPDVLQELVHEFGAGILDQSGALKRKELGHIVFADEAKKLKLNQIVHPHLIREIGFAIVAGQRDGWKRIVVDAALIYEATMESMFDKIIVVYADLPVRIARIQARDHFKENDILNRIRSQMDLEEKKQRADIVIINNGTLADLEKATLSIVPSL
ncbi:dephospho-CoA kinase [bacterium]|nr:dephospho-CoA kinase [bacterium]